jgi:hypothetical protein
MRGSVILDFDDEPEIISNERLYDYSGSKNLAALKSFQATADTRDATLSDLTDFFPQLEKLRLDNSIIPSLREIGCSFANLTFLSLTHCGLSSLEGISTISRNIEELYLSFNKISDLSELIGMEKLRILDLEQNEVSAFSNLHFLKTCSQLRALTLSGNPATLNLENYAQEIENLLPQVIFLDGERVQPETLHPVTPPAQPRRPPPPATVAPPPPDHIGDLILVKPTLPRASPPDIALKIRARWGTSDMPHVVKPLGRSRRRISGKS